MDSATITDAFAAVQKKLKAAAATAGRIEQDVTLIAVSKQQQDERIDASLAAGHRIFGETGSRKQIFAGQSGKLFTPTYVFI